MPEFILFQGRIIRKDLVKSAYIAFNPKDGTIQPTVEFVGESSTLYLAKPTSSAEDALEVVYEFYKALGGDIGDVVECRRVMSDILKED